MSWKSEVIQEKVGKLGGAYNSRVGNQRFSAFISDKKYRARKGKSKDKINGKRSAFNRIDLIVFHTFHACSRRILQAIERDLNSGWTRRGTGYIAHFRCSLTQVRPLVTTGVGEPVGHRTVGAVDDARRSWMLDAGHGFFIWVNSLRDEPEGLVPRLFTEDL